MDKMYNWCGVFSKLALSRVTPRSYTVSLFQHLFVVGNVKYWVLSQLSLKRFLKYQFWALFSITVQYFHVYWGLQTLIFVIKNIGTIGYLSIL